MRPNSMRNRQAGRSSQSGSMILEALIAILIFSIGILGLIGMQVTAVGNVSDAKYRADATFLADQIVGQMWASRIPAATAGTFTIDPTYTWPGGAPNPLVTAWASGVAASLPGASAAVAIDPASQQQVTVTLTWVPPKGTQHVHTAVAFIN